MKTIVLVRHAKSSWGDIGLADEERPLNERGKKDAPEMARRLRKKNLDIDLLLTSPAKRANRTAKYFAEELDIKKKSVQVNEQLYAASPDDFQDVIKKLDDKYKTVAIFSHNPGITDFANSLTSVRIDNMPTCGVFAVQADAKKWEEFALTEKKFLFFDYPKNPAEKS